MRTKYGALRTISIFYKALALLVIIVTVASICVNFMTAPDVEPDFAIGFLNRNTLTLLRIFIPLVFGGAVALAFYATSEIFDLLIDVEENTRASRIVLTRLAKWMATDPARGPAGVRRQPPPAPPALDTDEPLLDLGDV